MAEQDVRDAARILMDAALRLIQRDPHQWSTRPCETCRLVSDLYGAPFGCDKYRQDETARRSRAAGGGT